MAKAKPKVVRRPAALLEIVVAADDIVQARSLAAGDQFIAAVNGTIERVAGMPGLGACLEPDAPALSDVRCFPVSKFRKSLVFYRPLPDGVEVVRVPRGARDIASIFEEDFGIADEDHETPWVARPSSTSQTRPPRDLPGGRNPDRPLVIPEAGFPMGGTRTVGMGWDAPE